MKVKYVDTVFLLLSKEAEKATTLSECLDVYERILDISPQGSMTGLSAKYHARQVLVVAELAYKIRRLEK